MAQGILNQRMVLTREPEVHAAAKPTVGALRYGRTGAWMRARSRALRRSVATPLLAFWAWLTLTMSPIGYQLWRAACVVKHGVTVASEAVAYTFLRAGRALLISVQQAHWETAKRIQAALIFTGCAVVVFTYGFYGMALEVFLDGESLGYIRNQSEFESAIANVNTKASELLNTPFELNPNVSYRFSLANRSKMFDGEEVEAMLFNEIPELTYMYVLNVNDAQLVGMDSYSDFDSLLSDRLRQVGTGFDEAAYLDTISISYQLAPASIHTTVSEFRSILNSNVNEARYATLAVSDLDHAARSYGMSSDALLALNPKLGMSRDTSLEGAQVQLNHSTPLFQVVTSRVEEYSETVHYESLTVEDNTMYEGRTKLVTSGVDGTQTITADVQFLNGRETGRDILGTAITLEPVNEVTAVGTLVPPTFIRPFYGKLTSTFKSRTLFGVTRMHTGIDLAGPIGSPIVASCAGTVTFVGYKNGYGLTVIIDHGNGLSTLYGHNSVNLVTVGQQVKQSELIAKVGNTGRSTGPHVHFEIRINGDPVNPLGYV